MRPAKGREYRMADKTEWVVNGFQFGTQQDAELAQNEKIRIERLEEKLDYQNQEMVYAVYKKAVNNRVFRTPVGYDFLKRLQRILHDNAQEDIANIPIYGVYSMRESANPTIERIQASRKPVKEKPKQEFFSRKTSIIVNIGLLVLVIVMFVIATTGSNPTIINYERTLQNRYAEWEQQLSDREQAIREKEKELLIAE
ncbi:MAG: DUF334 domain-containing protein [Lachnospiraceae bacterium]|nr:DUF334 domain-containing protein [Lachnospiraceae bacterium]